MFSRALLALPFLTAAAHAAAQEPLARPGIDAPALAALGRYGAGTTTVELVQAGQLDPARGAASPELADRHLTVRVWYPAAPSGAAPATYASALPGPDGQPVPFSVPGIAVAGAPEADGRFPLVVLAHGYSNTPELLAWLGENLATKGYVVAAPFFDDPPISDAAKFVGPIARRPLDIAFVAAEIQRRARAGTSPFDHTDPRRIGLIGYSMGGYGVLTAAGAPLSIDLAKATRGVLAPFVAGAPRASELRVTDLHAVVVISPAMRIGKLTLWAPGGLGAIRVPTFFIAGSQDHLVGYDPGVHTVFEAETNAPRYLLTFREAGHNIALVDAPPTMRDRLWDEDWFEDPVWRKARLTEIEQHFVTAFLGVHLKGETGKRAYIDGQVTNSDDGTWREPPATYEMVSPGPPASTIWTGFQGAHAAGMTLETRAPAQ